MHRPAAGPEPGRLAAGQPQKARRGSPADGAAGRPSKRETPDENGKTQRADSLIMKKIKKKKEKETPGRYEGETPEDVQQRSADSVCWAHPH